MNRVLSHRYHWLCTCGYRSICAYCVWCERLHSIHLICEAVVSSAAVTNFSCIIGLLQWRPDPNQLAVFFVFPALWGMSDAIWQTQTNGRKPIISVNRSEQSQKEDRCSHQTFNIRDQGNIQINVGKFWGTIMCCGKRSKTKSKDSFLVFFPQQIWMTTIILTKLILIKQW